MREILFRGKRIDNGEWVYGYVVEMCDETDDSKTEIWIDSYRKETKDTFFGIDGYTEYSWRVDPTTIGQYTGIKDKNGTKIFEGDIVQVVGFYEHTHAWVENYEIRFIDYAWQSYNAFSETATPIGDWDGIANGTVIGNIHDKEVVE